MNVHDYATRQAAADRAAGIGTVAPNPVDVARTMLDHAVGAGVDVEMVARAIPVNTLRALVTNTVFAMAAGECDIPDWLSAAERVLAAS